MRHQDFNRIHAEFCSYYQNQSKGETEYYDWLHALSLDESKPYGSARESFKWAKTMLNFLKEDADSKYYGVIVGLPWRSMNGNVYKERDLIAAALSLKGKHPSLNHKDEFWFNEQSRWGTLTVEDAKYEEGAVEAVLKVPKTAVCPICNGDKMTELIDKQHIVNVSLEGNNNGAFEFTDPPFTLLTSDVLPGIPLARIKPLEQIVSEAFAGTKIPGSKKMKIPVKIMEDQFQKTPASEQPAAVNTKSIEDPNFKGTWGTPVSSDALLHSNTDSSGNTTVQMGESPASIVMKQHEAADENPMANSCPEGTKFNPATGKCEPCSAECKCQEEDTSQPKPEDIRSGPYRSKAPDRAIPEAGSLPSSAKQDVWQGTSPVSPGVKVGTAPFENLATLDAQRAKINAEINAKNTESKAVTAVESAELKAKTWEANYSGLYLKHEQLIGMYKQQDLNLKQVNEQREEAVRAMHNSDVDRQKYERLFNDEAGNRRKIEMQLQDTQNQLNMISRKYNESLGTNLELSKKLTLANEEYLDVARKLDATDEALERSRIEAKKIVKIRV